MRESKRGESGERGRWWREGGREGGRVRAEREGGGGRREGGRESERRERRGREVVEGVRNHEEEGEMWKNQRPHPPVTATSEVLSFSSHHQLLAGPER